MLLPKKPLLTNSERQRIRELKAQGLTNVAITKQIGCGAQQVGNYLRNLPGRVIPTVAITDSQYRLIIECAQSQLSVEATATRLGVDAEALRQELAGAKSMSSKRIGQIRQILVENI